MAHIRAILESTTLGSLEMPTCGESGVDSRGSCCGIRDLGYMVLRESETSGI